METQNLNGKGAERGMHLHDNYNLRSVNDLWIFAIFSFSVSVSIHAIVFSKIFFFRVKVSPFLKKKGHFHFPIICKYQPQNTNLLSPNCVPCRCLYFTVFLLSGVVKPFRNDFKLTICLSEQIGKVIFFLFLFFLWPNPDLNRFSFKVIALNPPFRLNISKQWRKTIQGFKCIVRWTKMRK